MSQAFLDSGYWLVRLLRRAVKQRRLNWYKFLCGGCSKRTHKSIHTGIWLPKLECEQAMTSILVLTLLGADRDRNQRHNMARAILDYIYSDYSPDEVKLHILLIRDPTTLAKTVP
jgi:ribosomal protein L37AE/L43A